MFFLTMKNPRSSHRFGSVSFFDKDFLLSLPICFFADGDGGGGGSPGGSGDGGSPSGGAGGSGGSGGSAGGEPGAGAGAGGGPGQGDGGSPGAGNGDKGDKGNGQPQYVTPQILQGVLEAHKRASQAEIAKLRDQNKQLVETLTALNKRLEQLATPKGGSSKKGDDDKGADDSEKVELRRKIAELESRLQENERKRQEAEQREREFKFRTAVKDALVKAGCIAPDEAFLVIKPRLSMSDDGERIFATVKTEWGEQDLTLEEYIQREFAENVLPQLFRGKMRPGAPAGGDSGGGRSFMYTREQILDNPEEYAKDPEKARQAIERGLVKGLDLPRNRRR